MDEFMAGLVADLKPVRRRRPAVEAAVVATLFAAELALWLLTDNARENLAQVAMTTQTFWWKLASAGVLTVIACAAALSSLTPVGSPRRGLMAFGVGCVVFLIIGAGLDWSLGLTNLAARLPLSAGLDCLSHLVSLSLPPLVVLGFLMRRGAATNLSGTALACGLAAAGWGAFVFVFTCPHDDPLFVAIWYALAMASTALLARLVLPLVSRW